MASLMDTLSTTLTPQTLGTIGKRIGVTEDTLQKGMDAAVPTVLGSLSKSASTPAGLDDILSQVTSMQGSAKDGDALGSVLGSLTGSGGLGGLLGGLMGGGSAPGAAGNDMLGGLLGPAIGAISATLSKKLGFDIGPILSMAAPLLIGLLSNTAKSQNLDKQGIASLLQTESKAYFDKGGETATLVQSALAAGDQANALKATFGGDWTKVRVAPLAVARLVIESSRSGPVGTIKELSAAAETVGAAAKAADPASLFNVAYATDPSQAEFDQIGASVKKDGLMALVRDSELAVKLRLPEQAAAYKSLLLDVANKTAAASKEGGFLGIGGTQVNEKEKAVIDEIARLLA